MIDRQKEIKQQIMLDFLDMHMFCQRKILKWYKGGIPSLKFEKDKQHGLRKR